MESSPSIVIKVKYGDVLRRFETQFVDKGQYLSMDGLRNRIVPLFSFAPDTELMLTYIDEDNDVVNLVDDNDIRDVIKQGLNPLRITVKVNSGKDGEQYACLTGSSAPLRSQVNQPLENLHAGVSEILSTMPEPPREALVEVSTDLTSKASSSAPDISELVDCLAKLGLSYLSQIPDSQPGLLSSILGGVSRRTDATETTDVGLSKVDPAATSQTRPTSPNNNESVEGLKPGASVENEVKVPSTTGVKTGSSPFDFRAVAAALESQNMNSALPFYDYLLGPVLTCPRSNLSPSGREEKFKKTVEMLPLPPVVYNAGKIVEPGSMSSNLPPVTNKVTTVEVAGKPNEPNFGSSHANVDAAAHKAGEYINVRERAALHDSSGKSSGPILALGAKNKSPFSGKSMGNVSTLKPYSFQAIVALMTHSQNDGFVKSAGPLVPTSTINECPFSGIAVGNISTVQPCNSSEAITSRMSINQNDGHQNTVRHGIICDGCDVSPITGPRFKSKVKHSDPILPHGAMEECPFSGLAGGTVSSTVPPYNSSEAISSRSVTEDDGQQNTIHLGFICDGCDVHPITGPRFKSKAKEDYDLCSACFEKMGNDADYIRMDWPEVQQSHISSVGGFGKSSGPISPPSAMNECPFSGIGVGNVSTFPPHNSSDVISSRKSFSLNDGCQNTVHHGITCDGCDVHPITGQRFKSKVKVDYDLCSTCFEKMGNDADYILMDFPVVRRSHMSFIGRSHDSQATGKGPVLPLGYSGHVVKPFAIKLDNCFVEDVNVIDGTVMAPLIPFTKIWRMKNSGAVGWLRGTQLVWIGGDKLSSSLSVELKVPEGGVWMGQELDVMVDFVSPKLPGRYISYWRMATPSGEKFGQCIWVLIQVDSSSKKSLHETTRNLNLNLPPVSNGLVGTEIMNIEPEPPVKGSHPEPDNSINIVELLQPETEQALKLPANDSLLVGNGASSCSVPFTASSSVSYPISHPSEVPPALSSVPFTLLPQAKLEASVAAASHSAVDDLSGKNQVEEKLLRKLDEMGFKQTDLNKMILRKNEYSLEQAVDELCGSAEWDSILEELEEMGFYDRETNKMLLKKNDGSIKRVVMDLVAGEKN